MWIPPPAPKAVNTSAPSGLSTSGTSPVPVKADKPPAIDSDEDGFTVVNRKGKNKTIKLQRKRNRAVQGAKAKPVKPPIQHPISSSQSGLSRSRTAARPPPVHGSSMEVDTPTVCSNNRFAALNVVSEQDPFDQSTGTGTTFSELDIHASIKRTSLVEATSDLFPPDPMNEDSTPSARVHSDVMEQPADKGEPEKEKLICQVNREHVEGARLLPTSILSSPSPGGLHTTNGGKSYGISESQRKAIADRISVSSSICIDETDNWCPREWDYFNDLCISLGLGPDNCIEDVESDTENGTAQFFSGLLKAGCLKSNLGILIWIFRMGIWALLYARFNRGIWPIMVMAIRMEFRNIGLRAIFHAGLIIPEFGACLEALLISLQNFGFPTWESLPKKDQPPSALPSRRSARGAAKSASTDEIEAPGLPPVGLGEYQVGPAPSPKPPSLVCPIDVCNTNKENSTIPSVTVSLNGSEQDASKDETNGPAKKFAWNRVTCAYYGGHGRVSY
ncbi:hypothetical protein L1987_45389 [Smallanthus sonchifolius]|uniref:Uncharacterized protein n=1 Tax=Smallanthus sonchifolius TaxID=185202 RepID=A0ACB9GRY9_9ASTR|nr:hypothetical protein L1987_45389 [Smallanthus sonchifolius]